MSVAVSIIVGFCVIVGALLVLTVSVAFFKERDAISRINALGPATALGLPLIVLGAFVESTWRDGFGGWMLFKTLLTIVSLVLVSSVASNVLGRAAYLSGTPLDPETSPNDLAVDPEDESLR